MNNLLKKIRERGYWQILFHPADFNEKRVTRIQDLAPIVRAAAVEFRGWDFPHISREGPTIGLDWIEDKVEWSEYFETWRFYQSGQFVYYGGIRTDWLDQSEFQAPMKQWRPGLLLPVTDTVFKFTEIFEFASRLSSGPLDAPHVTLRISLSGLDQRELWIDNPNRSGFHAPRKAAIPEYSQTFQLGRDQLLAETRQLAVVAAEELFARFNWTPGGEFLGVMQGELFRR
jgi:hypothetical protein